MKKDAIISLFMILAVLTGVGAADLPVALLFPATAGAGAEPPLAGQTTQAIKTYLRQTGKADVVEFDADSPFIKRAIMEHRVKADELVAVTSPEARINMAKLLAADLVVSADVTMKDGTITVSGWLAQVATKKVWKMDARAVVSAEGSREHAVSNAIQSATSTIIYEFAEKALKDVQAVPEPAVPETTTPVVVEQPIEAHPVAPADNATAHLAKADQFLKDGDTASAILELRQAVNAEPKNIDIRLRLVRLYADRQMIAQAVEALERAQQIDPANETIRKELAAIYEKAGQTDKAAEVYVARANSDPTNLDLRLAAGDFYQQKKMYEEAESQYEIASQLDPTNPVPHERLTLLLATQSLFHDGRKSLEKLQQLDPKPEPQVSNDRYQRLIALVDRDLKDLLRQYDNGVTSFAGKDMTREYFYELLKGIDLRVESILKFMDILATPKSETTTHRRRVLGGSLMTQACNHARRYLETNKDSEKEDADILIAEARKQIAGK